MAWLVFMGWEISQANEWEDYSNYFKEGTGISRNWTTTHFLTYYGWTQNCHGAGGCVIQMLTYYNEHIMSLKVYWKSTCLPSWTYLVLTSFCHVLWLCHSFKGCTLPPSLLFQFGGCTMHSRGERRPKGRQIFLCLNFSCLAIKYEFCFTKKTYGTFCLCQIPFGVLRK